MNLARSKDRFTRGVSDNVEGVQYAGALAGVNDEHRC
jgi:hypothetical protein